MTRNKMKNFAVQQNVAGKSRGWIKRTKEKVRKNRETGAAHGCGAESVVLT